MKPEFKLPNYGLLKLTKDRNNYSWFGSVNMSVSETPVELTIETDKDNEPLTEQINLIKNFENNWNSLSDKLFEFMVDSFRDSQWEKNKDELKKMYYLSAIDLKRGNFDWWVVMEPQIDVPTIFNFLPRFTIRNNEIIWSNLKNTQ